MHFGQRKSESPEICALAAFRKAINENYPEKSLDAVGVSVINVISKRMLSSVTWTG